MSKPRVYFDDDTVPIVDEILSKTGLKTYTHVVNSMIKKYGKDFIHSYNRFISESDLPTPQRNINLNSLESFNHE